MIELRTHIIPTKVEFIDVPGDKLLNLDSIAAFAAFGFFLGDSTYYQNKKALLPGAIYNEINGHLKFNGYHFKWEYKPREITLKQSTEEFAVLFERIMAEQSEGRKMVLPLSGGIDSRTQAAALRNKDKVHGFSYEFRNGHPETKYGKSIADAMDIPITTWKVPPGYIWERIDRLAELNKCYGDWTHPRQAAFSGKYAQLGDTFTLGHWGDVLFDDMGVADNISLDDQKKTIQKKLLKKGGAELAQMLWDAWGLQSSFERYLNEELERWYGEINEGGSANARIRAFKSRHWATRWTAQNLIYFEDELPITVPYFDDRMCEFICTLPEEHLAGRQIQIEYLKMVAPELAKIEWQAQRPYNLYNYHKNKTPHNLPHRIKSKIKRSYKTLRGRRLVQRNWELQFLGEENDRQLRAWLFDNREFEEWIPKELTNKVYQNFKTQDMVYWSHPLSMLLTLAVFIKKEKSG